MTGQKDVKDFLLPDTPSQDLIWANFEEIAPNPSEGGTLPHYLALLFGGQVWWELCRYQIVAISTNHGERTEIENKCSSGNWSSTIPSSPIGKLIWTKSL